MFFICFLFSEKYKKNINVLISFNVFIYFIVLKIFDVVDLDLVGVIFFLKNYVIEYIVDFRFIFLKLGILIFKNILFIK